VVCALKVGKLVISAKEADAGFLVAIIDKPIKRRGFCVSRGDPGYVTP
jgi:hypothetical protein